MGLIAIVWTLYKWLAFVVGWLGTPLVLAIAGVALADFLLHRQFDAPDKSKHAFVITGADSGIGLEITKALDQRGFRVFAGVFLPSGADALKQCSERVHPVRVDITKHDSVVAAASEVRRLCSEHKCQVYGLFNNAGIAFSGPLVCVPMEKLQNQFDVNYFGHIDVTQQFLPLLMETTLDLPKGGARIVNTCSVAGRISGFNFGPYSGSKHALEAATDAMRQELAPFNIPVIAIEPGFIQTPLVDSIVQVGTANWRQCMNRELYPCQESSIAKHGRRPYEEMALPVSAVVAPICDALLSEKPRTRYTFAKGLNPIRLAILPTCVKDKLNDLVMKMERSPTPRDDARRWLDGLAKQS